MRQYGTRYHSTGYFTRGHKPTEAGLIYGTEPETQKQKNGMLLKEIKNYNWYSRTKQCQTSRVHNDFLT